MTNYLLAGGGTAGHVNPLLALADAIKAQPGKHNVYALGTEEGLEKRLVPFRGYVLLTVPRLPMPRKPNRYALTFPLKFKASVDLVKTILTGKQDRRSCWLWWLCFRSGLPSGEITQHPIRSSRSERATGLCQQGRR